MTLLSDLDLTKIVTTVMTHMPYSVAIGAQLIGIDKDGVHLKLPFREDLCGDLEGEITSSGALTALLDQGCGIAVWQALGGFHTIATLDLRIDYMRPARAKTDLLMTAKCYKTTRSIGFVRAFAYDDSMDDPVAAVQAAFSITKSASQDHSEILP